MAEKTAAQKRQEAEAAKQADAAEQAAKVGKAKDSGKLTVVLRDEADSTIDSVSKLIAAQGATLRSSSKGKMTVELPEGSERNTDALRQRIVGHLLGDPLVVGVE